MEYNDYGTAPAPDDRVQKVSRPRNTSDPRTYPSYEAGLKAAQQAGALCGAPPAPRASASDYARELVELVLNQRSLLTLVEAAVFGSVPSSGKDQEFYQGDGLLGTLEGLRPLLNDNIERLNIIGVRLGVR